MANNILLSFLVPSYNHAKYIKETIHSIWKQNLSNIEIIAIDDGSSDNSFEILKNLQKESPVQMYIETHKNMGVVRTINKAFSKSNGKYIAIIGSDDLYIEDSLKPLLAILEDQTNTKIVYGNGHSFSEKGIHSNKVHHEKIANMLAQPPSKVLDSLLSSVPRPLLLQCSIIESKMLQDIGGWDEEIQLDDWPMNIKIFKYLLDNNFTHKFLDHSITLYRDHAKQTNKNAIKMFAMTEEVIEHYSPTHIKKKFFASEAIKHSRILFKLKHTREANQLLKRVFKADPSLINIFKIAHNFIKYNIVYFFK